MPEPKITNFRSVNSTVDRCGVVTSVAVIDNNPVDGKRMQVTLVDSSQAKSGCRSVKPKADLTVKNAGVSHEFKTVSSEIVVIFQGVIRAQLKAVDSENFTSGDLFLDGRKGLG
ncbi:MAG: hypothetical protein M3Q07_03990 [Pseudobdellovibrionaceae bacterium]|nr:hypothetical protein [Pseudobdellovibrionaceae bacterium]